MIPRGSTRASVAVAGLVLSAVAGGCTEDRAAEPVPSVQPTASTAASPQVQPEPEPEPLNVRIASVPGTLPGPVRADVRRRLHGAIDSWMAAGFTGGDQPRTDFSSASGSYTPGAARLAWRQRSVTTNLRLAADLASVMPTRRVAKVSVLALSGRAVGASAQVLLVAVGARADGSQQELVLRGELDLVPTGRGWKIFGFDLVRSVGSPGTHATEQRRQQSRQRRDRTRSGPRPDRRAQ
jgi:hypothetical protein